MTEQTEEPVRPICCGKPMVWQPHDHSYYCQKCSNRRRDPEDEVLYRLVPTR